MSVQALPCAAGTEHGAHPRRQDDLGTQDRSQRKRGDVAVVLVDEPRARCVAQQQPHPLAQPALSPTGSRESGVVCERDSALALSVHSQ